MSRDGRDLGRRYDDSSGNDVDVSVRQSAAGATAAGAAGYDRPLLEIVRDLANVRDTDPAMYPAEYARLKATISDVDNLMTIFPPPALPSTSGEGESSSLGGGGGRTSFLTSPPPSGSSVAGRPANSGADAAPSGSPGTTPRTAANTSSHPPRRRAPLSSSPVMADNGSALDVSSIPGIERYDGDDGVGVGSYGRSSNASNNVDPAASDEFLRYNAEAMTKAKRVDATGASANSRVAESVSRSSDDRAGWTTGGSAAPRGHGSSTKDTYRDGGAVDTSRSGVVTSGNTTDTYTVGSRHAAQTSYYAGDEDMSRSTSAHAYGSGPRATRSPTRARKDRSAGRTTKATTASAMESSAAASPPPGSVSFRAASVREREERGGGDLSPRRRPRPSRSIDTTAGGLMLGQRPLRGADDDYGSVRRSGDHGAIESVIGSADGRVSGEWDAGLGLDDSRGSREIEQLLSGLPSRPPEGVDVGGRPLDTRDERCVCLQQPMIMRGFEGRYLRTRKDERDQDADDIDDTASTTTAATAASGGAAAGGTRSAGGPLGTVPAAAWSSSPGAIPSLEGLSINRLGGTVGSTVGGSSAAGEAGNSEADRQTMFMVDTGGFGTGDPAEVVRFVSTSRRSDQGPLVYGETVGIRSVAGKMKFLRPTASGSVVFARAQLGKYEKWLVLPYERRRGPTSQHHRVGAGRGEVGGRPEQCRGRVGTFVRKGDRIKFENLGSDETPRTTLIMRPRDFVGDVWEVAAARDEELRGEESEAWEIVPAGVPYLPAWRRQRPYLTGDFLLEPEPSGLPRDVSALFGSDKRHGGGGKESGFRAGLGEAMNSGQGRRGIAGVNGIGGSVDDDDNDGGSRRLGDLPEAVQEQLLLDDLLSGLMGHAGSYIVVKGVDGAEGEKPNSLAELEFAIDSDHIEQSLAYLAERVLPLCNCYVRVNRFATERVGYEFGKVAHALSAGMRRLLREYLILVAQLEHQLLQGKLSLQRLWFYVQPSLRTMETLEALTVELRDVKGGELLTRLKVLAGAGGDQASRKLHTFLLHEASVPYLEMLEMWIYQGNLNDQYGEFMIGQIEDVKKQDVGQDFNTKYWSGRYLLRASHVISSLAGRESKILTTGKYLNVVRESGRRVNCPSAGPIPADPGPAGEGLYARVIDGAYGFASRCLMDLVVREGQLFPRLESIKHYFLLDRGDFFEHLLDCAESELDKLVPEISVPRLESLLHLSVQMSSACHDPFKDDLSLEFSDDNLLKHLEKIHGHGGSGDPLGGRRPRGSSLRGGAGVTAPSPAARLGSDGDYTQRIIQGTAELRGVEGIMMSYTVQWPVNLVLSKKSLTKYQLLFRHVFFAKHVQRLLSKCWRDHQDTKQLELKGLMMASYHLRQRMLHFMQNLVYYMMLEVIEPNWHHFMDDLRKLCSGRDSDGFPSGEGGRTRGGTVERGGGAGTLDDVLHRHDQFQDLCLKECLLTNLALLKSLTKVMISCLHFGDQGAVFAEGWRKEEEVERLAQQQSRKPRRNEASSSSSSSSVMVTGGRGVPGERGVQKGLSGDVRTRHFRKRSSSVRKELDTAKYREYIRRSQEDFDASLHVFAGQLWRDAGAHYHSHLNNLCARLDYNGFFTRTSIGGGPNAARGASRVGAEARMTPGPVV